MSRLGDLENTIVSRLATATISGSPAFAVVRGFSGGNRPELREAIRREQAPAAYVAFTEELTAPETSDLRRGAKFVIMIAAKMLRASNDARHGDSDGRGAFELMDLVRARLDLYEPGGDTQLLSIHEKFVDADDRVVIYELAYRAWPIFLVEALLAEPPAIAPRMIGTATDYMRVDVASASYVLVGDARPLRPLPIIGPAGVISYNVGSYTTTQFSTNAEGSSSFPAVQIANTSDGGWRSLPVLIEDWCDVDDVAEIVVPLQAAAAASGDVSLRVNWEIARAGESGVIEGSAGNVVAGPTGAGDIAFLVAGTMAKSALAAGDCVSFAIQRLGASDAADTYTQDLLIARMGWINFRRVRL